MTLLFGDSKKLEKAVGTEAAEVIAKLFEAQDAAKRKDLATKTDLELKLAEAKADLIKWVAGMLAAQSVIIAALVKLLAK
jgi:phosphoribosyl-ATP pyrophosphohydrolase